MAMCENSGLALAGMPCTNSEFVDDIELDSDEFLLEICELGTTFGILKFVNDDDDADEPEPPAAVCS